MEDETQYANFRCPARYIQEIDELVKKKLYRDRTHFLVEAVREKLHPEEVREARKQQILYLLKEDPEIRRELDL